VSCNKGERARHSRVLGKQGEEEEEGFFSHKQTRFSGWIKQKNKNKTFYIFHNKTLIWIPN